MNDIIVFGIFFGGVLAITAAAGQLAVENKDPRKYLLSSLMFCTGVWQIYLGALYHGFLVGPYTFFRMSHLPLALCVGPLLYLFLRDIADAKYEFGKISLLHFAPALLVAFVQIPLHFADPKIKVRLEIFRTTSFRVPTPIPFSFPENGIRGSTFTPRHGWSPFPRLR
nr:hypothetical protein [Leptospira ellisii]